ncbi:hypothetical protein [Paludisphaera mucosa]|uniref:Uncharacterized protein n=1 Tax=Paludisphaera mucosa TaxID=3030827 RepID=A0ABT6FDK5_9BACT|nr:hypothetical protein [Paludisphaera mucosa]MDG3005656.1 hypothetical protein [Paludisphaera mucosa]
MEPIETLVRRLNRIRWCREMITADAEALIQDFLQKVRPAIQRVLATHDVTPAHAYGLTQTAGHASPESRHAVEVVFQKGLFIGAGARESIIVAISSAYGWEHDPELSDLPNPWLPMLNSIEMGYTPSGDEDPDGQWVQLWVGHRGGIATYLIV